MVGLTYKVAIGLSLYPAKTLPIFFFPPQCGKISNIRLVKNYKGKSKGFGYVEFTDSVSY